jgi:tellurite resistance protein
MFLNELNKNEGLAFMQLVKGLANSDNVFAKEEKNLYNDYLEELNIKEDEITDTDLNAVYENLKGSSERSKNIIYFELIGLALIDGEYDEREVDFLEEIGKTLGVKRNKRIAFANYFYNFVDVYSFSVVEAESKITLLKEQAEKLLA